ncbi:MAG: hypothetical protein A2X86_19885 [Bdellovibrionales bacterium GWA2_49_15]|nr:MAG: hypothetical protein A2X86_19885 [Bdellovibrionales bacterium GWA2_49_15]HAZ12521.1 hypothetical protein [Bdellovibrionales bacterium]
MSDRIILLVKFKNLFPKKINHALFCVAWMLGAFISEAILAQSNEAFEFKLGDNINVYSDKGYRKTKENIFEAVGNVVITHANETIYGEKATMFMETGDTKMEGNVRYVGPGFTLYGSQIDYNFITQDLTVQNARIISDNYIVLGKKISRVSQDVLIGEDAEYTTCRDCPESWSVFGKKVNITIGQYIRIRHALIKIKGVVALYVPYFVLPIKKKRETGLLFPHFGLNLNQGTRFQQPFFWAINDQQDLTFTPSVWGKRGPGAELEYRHMIGEKKWFEFDSIMAWDRMYQDGEYSDQQTGQHYFRHLSEWEHLFSFGYDVNHYVYMNDVRDLDVVRDYDQFLGNKVSGGELGGEIFVEKRFPTSLFSVQSYYKKNMLVDNPKEFDYSMVQIMPEVNASMVPIQIFNSKRSVFSMANLGVEGDLNFFKQDHLLEGRYIRNAYRFNAAPYVQWNLAQIGPVAVSNKTYFEYQQYYFPFELEQQSFGKNGILYETEANIEFQKYFGVAYQEVVNPDQIIGEAKQETSSNKKDGPNLIGSMMPFKKEFSKDKVEIPRHAYRHTQGFKLKHYYISNQRNWGNTRFSNQIKGPSGTPNSNGLFDGVDAVRGRENELNFKESRTALPTSNTLEFQWNNSVVRKSPQIYRPFEDDRYLRNNFSYAEVAYFNIGQGVDFNAMTDEFTDRLTRLAINAGMRGQSFGTSVSEYYYPRNNQHLMSVSVNKTFESTTLATALTYDSFTTPINKYITFSGSTVPSDLFTLGLGFDYDIVKKERTQESYRVGYTPHNRCWKLDFGYNVTQIQKSYSLNFYVNFNENNFTSVPGI